MKVGDLVIYFKPNKDSMGGYQKFEARIVRLSKRQAQIEIVSTGELKTRVMIENLQYPK